MSTRVFLHATLSVLALFLAAVRPVAAAEPASQCNVLLLVGDDLNTCLGCYGHPLVKSPHLDKLASQGVRFERAYCQYPICNPSRTSFLSGYRPGAGNKLLDSAVWLPMHFKKHGYTVTSVSKVAHTPLMAERCGFPADRSRAGLVDQVKDFLERNKDRPFFLAVGLTATHPGFQHTPQFLKLYPPEKITWTLEPATIRQNVPPVAFKGYLTSEKTDAERRKHTASYFAAVSTLDDQVGNILGALQRHQLTEKTIIVFTSDHGRHLGEHGGIYDKRSLFEESVRVPLIVVAQDRKRGAVCPRLVELVDLYPTLVELCGLPRPDHLQGTSFVPLLATPQRAWKQAVFSESGVSGTLGRSLRTEQYRYTEWDEKTAQLYDHKTDPHEHVNLANDPKHAETLAAMRRLLRGGWKAAAPTP